MTLVNDLDSTAFGYAGRVWRCRHCGRCLAKVRGPLVDPASDADDGVDDAPCVSIVCPRCGRESRFNPVTGAPVGLARRRRGAAEPSPPAAEPPEGPAASEGN